MAGKNRAHALPWGGGERLTWRELQRLAYRFPAYTAPDVRRFQWAGGPVVAYRVT